MGICLAPGGALSAPAPGAGVLFDSAHQLLMDGRIEQGAIYTATAGGAALETEIRRQLQNAVGQLNSGYAAPKLSSVRVKVLGVDAQPVAVDGKMLRRATYSAEMQVSWSRYSGVPSRYTLLLPARADGLGMEEFFNRYKAQCSDGEAELTVANYFYHYRPFADGCAVRSEPESRVAQVALTLERSAENTSGESPEYGKVWEDKKLVITAIFGKYESGGDDNDVGVQAYNRFYQGLLQALGAPKTINAPVGAGVPGRKYPYLEMTFAAAPGLVDVHVLMVDSLGAMPATFKSKYEARSGTSDLIAYNGHAGLGANVRLLAKMGRYKKDQYQLFLINACDTYAYLDPTLWNVHAAANPGAAPSKHLDVISNSMPAYFVHMADATLGTINSLIDQRDSFRSLINGYAGVQRAVVEGEQDNAWPGPF